MIINLDRNNIESIDFVSKEVSKVIKDGGIVISPTDTVYGILANVYDNNAIERIYQIKGRDKSKSLLVLIPDEKSISLFSNDKLPNIIKNKIPNELTFIMNLSKESVNNYLENTIALRISKDDYIQSILKHTPPIVAPSANPSGYGEIYDSNEIINIFQDKVDLIVDCGIIEKKLPSTIYDCINNKVIRQGSVIL